MRLQSELCMALCLGAMTHAQVSNEMDEAPDSGKQPSFLFIMSDDQDLMLDCVSYTPLTLRHMRDKGTSFNNHFVTTAMCCPSRVSLRTGRLAHNTNVTDVSPPWGGYPKFIDQGFNENFLPMWLQQAGYDTYYTGKLMNAHSLETYAHPHVAGFNGSDFLLDPYIYDYMNATYQRNHDPPISYLGRHTMEVLTEKAMGFLEDGLPGARPFFLAVAPIAPHPNMNGTYGGGSGPLWMDEPIPEEQFRHLFPNAKVPRTSNFNPKEPTGVSWIHDLPYRNQSVVDYNDHYYRQRLRALQSVDHLVDKLLTRLEESDQVENTYIIYTSDNGFHIGQHRLPPGKTCGFEEDIRVPFFIRGPGIPEGGIEKSVSTHIDLAPTLFKFAGIPLRSDFDGTPLKIGEESKTDYEHVTVEYWGQAMLEGALSNLCIPTVPNNTYKGVRVLSNEYNLYYSVWCNNEHELYDLTNDPYQIHNLVPGQHPAEGDAHTIMGHALSEVISRLDTLLMVLKSCQGKTCVDPWRVLHPDGSVATLRDAMSPQYDRFYQDQYRVSFSRCEYGYLVDAEGPMQLATYRNGYSLETWV